MKIASWNVNSLKVRLPQVRTWLETHNPDVLALQETKLIDTDFPVETLRAMGYHAVFSGQKTYNGVAILSREEMTDPVTDPPGLEDAQRRILAVNIGDLRIINLYVVNGENVGTEKFAYKLDWLRRMRDWLSEEVIRYPRAVILGDFNIAPDDRDVYDPIEWGAEILCSPEERAALQRILDLGLVDSFRLQDQPEKRFSWFDYRAASFRRNRGLRIDLILLTEILASHCRQSTIDLEPRAWERPSDHAPVWVELEWGDSARQEHDAERSHLK